MWLIEKIDRFSTDESKRDEYVVENVCTWCGRKVMGLAMLCTNRQRCSIPLHMAVRLTPAVDSVQV